MEDTVRIFVRSVGGVMGSIDLSWSINKELDSYINIYGSRGTIAVGWKESKYRQSSSRDWVVFGKGYDKVQAFRSQINNFARAILGREMLLITAKDALASVEVIEAAYRALGQDHWVSVNREPAADWRSNGHLAATAVEDMSTRVHPTAIVEDGVSHRRGHFGLGQRAHSPLDVHRRAVHHRRKDVHRLWRPDRKPREDQCFRVHLQRGHDRGWRDGQRGHHFHERSLSARDDARPQEAAAVRSRTSTLARPLSAKGRPSAPAALIGSNLEIGRFAMIGMGSVVTRSVPAFHLALGSPAASVGCVCRCGQLLLRFEEPASATRERSLLRGLRTRVFHSPGRRNGTGAADVIRSI